MLHAFVWLRKHISKGSTTQLILETRQSSLKKRTVSGNASDLNTQNAGEHSAPQPETIGASRNRRINGLPHRQRKADGVQRHQTLQTAQRHNASKPRSAHDASNPAARRHPAAERMLQLQPYIHWDSSFLGSSHTPDTSTAARCPESRLPQLLAMLAASVPVARERACPLLSFKHRFAHPAKARARITQRRSGYIAYHTCTYARYGKPSISIFFSPQ